MDNQNANGGFSPNPANFSGQFGSYDPNAGQQVISSGQNTPQSAPIDPTTGVVMPQANYGQAITAPIEPIPAQPEAQESTLQPTVETSPQSENSADKFIVKPNLVNLQTKSLVESQREMSADELAKANAYAAEIQRQERAAKRQKAAKRIGVYIALGIFGITFLGVLVFLLVQIVNTSRGGIQIGDQQGDGDKIKLSVIDGYQCKTEKCTRMDDMPDGRIILRDEGYIIYNKQDSTATPITIDDQEYNSIKSFNWGKKVYAVLDPVSDKSGLFSISDNRMVVDYHYDKFYTDPKNSDIYGDMAWITDQYIIASTSSPNEYSVVDLLTGKSILRGSERVFMHDGYFIGYEANNERRAYTSGSSKAFLIVKDGDNLFTRNGILIYVSGNGNMVRYYDANGSIVPANKISFWSEISRLQREKLVAELKGNNKYYKIPGNK